MAQSFHPGAPSGSALPAAAQWIEGVLYGSLGTSLAVIAVAWFGFEMLTGRLPLRRGWIMVLGCFIFFGAPLLAKELIELTHNSNGTNSVTTVQRIVVPPAPAPSNPPPFDPYAGASVPDARN